MATLTVARAERPFRRLGGGTWQTGRVYADFVVDGKPLSTHAHRCGDLISRLGWGALTAQQDTVAHLLCERAPDFPWGGGRTGLYVCPEDGDLHCGAVTAVVERQGTEVVWRDFGYETGLDIDPPELDTRDLEGLGPYRFAWVEYEAAIRAGFGMDGFNAAGQRPQGILRTWARWLGFRKAAT
jgi:hypothetical protein